MGGIMVTPFNKIINEVAQTNCHSTGSRIEAVSSQVSGVLLGGTKEASGRGARDGGKERARERERERERKRESAMGDM